MSTVGQIYDLGAKESFELKVNDDTRTQLGRGFYGSRIIVCQNYFVKLIFKPWVVRSSSPPQGWGRHKFRAEILQIQFLFF